MKYIILSLVLLTITIYSKAQTKPPKIKIYLEDTGSISNAVKNTVNQIEQYKGVDAAAIGVAGSKTDQYKRLEQLIHEATTQELLQLTNHKSPIVRAYAFWALGKREYKSIIPKVVEKHLKDNESFTYTSGCLPQTEHINSFYLQTLIYHPDFSYLKLSKAEKEKYNNLLKEIRK